MNGQKLRERRFEYRMKPWMLGFFLLLTPFSLFAGFAGFAAIWPMFEPTPHTLTINDKVFVGQRAVLLGIGIVIFSTAWCSLVAYMFRLEQRCSKEVILGLTEIDIPLTVAGEVNKSLDYEEIMDTQIVSSDESTDLIIFTMERKYRFEDRRFANQKEFQDFCAIIEGRYKPSDTT